MIRLDSHGRSLVDAAFLFALMGCEAVADVPFADGSVPVGESWRMDAEEWAKYRSVCGDPAKMNRRAALV
jgi:hypothetical protein